MTLKEAYSYSVLFLERNGIEEADFKALCLVCSLDGIKNSEYNTHMDDEIIMSTLAKRLWRLKTGEPLQYVIGKWDFYESEFFVGPGVLIPRPETEELTDAVIRYAKTLTAPVIYDLCAGSGCIGISVAKKVQSAQVYCVEKSKDAFLYLQKNAKDVANVTIMNADILDDLSLSPADIIVSNPPYIRTADLAALQSEVQQEPAMALDGGSDGLAFYRVINDKWYKALKDGGKLFLEIGNEQGKDVPSVLHHFKDISVKKDIYGNDRMVVAVKR